MIKVVVAVSFHGALPPPPGRSGGGGNPPRESGWQGVADPSDSLVLLGYESSDAAGEDLRRLVEGADPEPSNVSLPTEVHHVVIERGRGRVLDDLPQGSYLAVGLATASPGYGVEARERLEEILATFAQVEGYTGHLEGYNETVEEEAWTFVFGTDLLPAARPSECRDRHAVLPPRLLTGMLLLAPPPSSIDG